MRPVRLDGRSLTQRMLVEVAHGATVELDAGALKAVARAAEFLAEQVAREEPIYGVSTGFGSNADKLLGARPLRDAKSGRSLHVELQDNLIVTHAVCVGDPFSPEVVRAMLCIRINTLLRGHSGIRVETLQAMAAMLNAGVVPVVPQLGSVGASGDLAPLSHLAIVLHRRRRSLRRRRARVGRRSLASQGPASGVAVVQGRARAQQRHGADARVRLARVAAPGRIARHGRHRRGDDDRRLRRAPGCVRRRSACAAPASGAGACGRTSAPVARRFDARRHSVSPRAEVPRMGAERVGRRRIAATCPSTSAGIGCRSRQRHGREKFYKRFRPFRGGKKHQPQDSYSLRCVPQVHGAVRDAMEQARRVFDVELNSVTDNPLVFPDAQAQHVEEQVISAGHFHGMPLALAMSYVKAAIPVLASISERRLNKLVDPATNDGLPAFLIGNEDGTESGLMIVQYTAAAIVNDLASRAMPASVYSIPTSANAEDHVSMGANEARHVLAMVADLGKVLGLELMTAAQALDLRRDMINAARSLADRADAEAFATKVQGGPLKDDADRARLPRRSRWPARGTRRCGGLPVRAARWKPRMRRSARASRPMDRDRALDGDVAMAVRLVTENVVLDAARAALND